MGRNSSNRISAVPVRDDKKQKALACLRSFFLQSHKAHFIFFHIKQFSRTSPNKWKLQYENTFLVVEKCFLIQQIGSAVTWATQCSLTEQLIGVTQYWLNYLHPELTNQQRRQANIHCKSNNLNLITKNESMGKKS